MNGKRINQQNLAAHIPVKDNTYVTGEELANVVEFQVVQGRGHQSLQFGGGKVLLLSLGAFGLIPDARGSGDDPLADNRVQMRGERRDSSVLHLIL